MRLGHLHLSGRLSGKQIYLSGRQEKSVDFLFYKSNTGSMVHIALTGKMPLNHISCLLPLQ